jgi:hypothetical protein
MLLIEHYLHHTYKQPNLEAVVQQMLGMTNRLA